MKCFERETMKELLSSSFHFSFWLLFSSHMASSPSSCFVVMVSSAVSSLGLESSWEGAEDGGGVAVVSAAAVAVAVAALAAAAAAAARAASCFFRASSGRAILMPTSYEDRYPPEIRVGDFPMRFFFAATSTSASRRSFVVFFKKKGD